MGLAFPKPGKVRKNLVQIRADAGLITAEIGAGHEVFEHRHLGKDPAALRYMTDPAADDRLGRQPVDALTVKGYLAVAQRDQAGDGAKGRALAGAVGADNGHQPTSVDPDADAPDGRHLLVMHRCVVD